MKEIKKIVITGAAGFLGGRMAKQLAAIGGAEVIATSRRTVRKAELEACGCEFVPGDLLDTNFCRQLVKDANVVVHCAALSAPWGKYNAFYDANVIATQNLLNAAQNSGVKRFIYISTPSIYCNYASRLAVSEADPLPANAINEYAATKLIAENWILSKNCTDTQTIALRPRAIIGAGDTVIFPRVLNAYKKERLKIVGDGKNVCDLTSVTNVIEAVRCCLTANETAMGQAYNITNDEPVPFWKALNYVFEELNMTPPGRSVPRTIAMAAARVFELWSKLQPGQPEPALTRYGVSVLADSMTLDIAKAKTNLGYKPIQTTFEGLKEFTTWYQQQQ